MCSHSVSAPILRPAGNEIIVEGIMGASGLGSLLVKEGFLTEQDRVTITKTCGQGSWAFAKTILAIGLLDEDELAAFFAERTKYIVAARDFLDHLDQGAIQSIDKRMISKLEILPLKRDADKITVAVLDPLDRSTLKQLEFFTGLIVEPVIAPMSQLYEGLVRLDPDFSPRDTSLSQFLQNHVGAAWIKQRIVNGDDAMETGATPGSATFEFREDDVEELDDDESGIEAVDDDFDDVSGDVSDDFDDGMEDDGVSLDAENDPFAGTKSTEEADSFDSSGDNSDDLFAEGASTDADELTAGADDASASGSDDDFFPADSTESADSAADLLAEADDEFGDAPLDADDLTASLAPEKKNISGAKAADSGPPVVGEDDAIFDALEDDSPSLESAAESDALTDEGTGLEDLTENAADDFGAEDLGSSEDLGALEDLSAADDFNAADETNVSDELSASDEIAVGDELSASDEIAVGDELSASDEIAVGDDLSANDFGSEGESLSEDFSADDFAAGADDFGADEKPEVAAKAAPQNSRQAARSKGAFDAEEETAINLRPNPRPSNDDDDIALHPPKILPDNDERDPGLTATALLNEALLRLSLCFDKESVDALLNETLPRMSAAGCLIRTDGPVRSWAQGKEGPSKLPKGALENLTTKSKEGKWQKISLSRPQSWTTKDLSLSAYRTGNWIWAHDSGEENEIFIETVESFVNQLQGK